MQVSVDSKEGLERKLTITVAAELFDKTYDGHVKHLAKNRKIDGFRPGKVPASVIIKQFGEGIYHEVSNELMQRHFYDAAIEEKLNPAGAPTFTPKSREKGNDFVFSATFEVYPEVKLTDLTTLSIEKNVAKITAKDLDKMIETLRKQHSTWDEVERDAELNDQVNIDFNGTIEGEKFEGGTAESFQLVLGSGRMIPGFESEIIGKAPKAEFAIKVTFPDDYHAEKLKGKTADFNIVLHKVEAQILPEVTSEFIKKFGVESGELEVLKSDIKKNMNRELEQVLKSTAKESVITALLASNELVIPKALIASEVDVLRKQAVERYSSQSEAKKMPKLPDGLFSEQAEKRIKIGMLLGEVIKSNKLTVDQKKVDSLIENEASAYENPSEIIAHYKKSKEIMRNVENIALEEQAVEFIAEKAQVSEIKKSFDDVMNKPAS